MDYSIEAQPLESGPGSFTFSLDSLYARFCQMADQRHRRGVRYSLAFVLTVMTLAKLAGADKPQAIAQWVAERAALWIKTFELKRACMPSHHTYRRVMQTAVRPEDWEQVVTDFLKTLPPRGTPVHISLDGKTVRGTLAWGESRGLHLLAAYGPEIGLVLCQRAVDPSTNEIGMAPQVLQQLDLPGKTPAPPCIPTAQAVGTGVRVVTGDAIDAQRDLSQRIGDAGGDYVWTVKDTLREPRLRADIEKRFAPAPSLVNGFNTGPTDYRTARTVDKGHGRLEIRTLTATADLQAYSDWPYLAQVFRLERTTTLVARGQVRHEVVYGLTSLAAAQAGPHRLLHLVREHWQQENGLHYRRDTCTTVRCVCHSAGRRHAPQTLAGGAGARHAQQSGPGAADPHPVHQRAPSPPPL